MGRRHREDTIRIFLDETKTFEKSVQDTSAESTFYQDPRITPEAMTALKDNAASSCWKPKTAEIACRDERNS